jgi:hypothetical protein
LETWPERSCTIDLGKAFPITAAAEWGGWLSANVTKRDAWLGGLVVSPSDGSRFILGGRLEPAAAEPEGGVVLAGRKPIVVSPVVFLSQPFKLDRILARV